MGFVQKALLSFAILIASNSMALPESQLQKLMVGEVQTYLEKNGKVEPIVGTDGLILSTFTLSGPGSKGDVILITGQGEFIPKYYELAYDLIQRGYSKIHMLDHRGQGTSARVLPESPEKGSVDTFSDYVNDLTQFVRSVQADRPDKKLFLLAHSMGSAVSVLMLGRKFKDEKVFDAVAFSAPMFAMYVPVARDTRFLMPVLRTLCLVEESCDDFAPGKSEFNLYLDFKTNVLTHSQARWNMHRSMLQADPRIGISGPTNRWVLEATKAAKKIALIKPPKHTPMMLFQAGEDKVVLPEAQVQYCAKSGSCQLVRVKDAKHEILQESDKIRNKVLDRIDRFFSNSSSLKTVFL